MVGTVAPSGHRWLTESGGLRAVVVQAGRGVRAYRRRGRDYVDGYPDVETAPLTSGQVFVPRPNRRQHGLVEPA